MSRTGRVGLVLSLVASLLLMGCTGGWIRDFGMAGDPGREGKERPGDLYVQLAAEYLRQGQPEIARRKLDNALAVDPSHPQAHNLMALIYQRSGQSQLAERYFRTASDLQPEDPYVLNAYASFLCGSRRFAEARSRYEKALANSRYTAPWIAMTNLGTCAKYSGNANQAEIHFHRALTTNPRLGSAIAVLADLNYGRGRYRSARTYLDPLVSAILIE